MDYPTPVKCKKYTHEETMAILQQAIAASERGDEAEYKRLVRLFPLPAYLAKTLKDLYGKEYVLNFGYDLSEAEKRYGKDWLDN